MRCRLSSLFLVLSTVLAAAVLCACGGGSTNISSIAITPTTASVPLNTQATFVATVNLINSTVTTTTAVTWEVNGVAGGNAATGTIVSSGTNAQDGIYTAPAVVPSTNNGTVMITAVINTTSTVTTTGTATTNSNTTITSNTATVTITGGVGLAISPTTASVPAGGSFQFSATVNSVTDVNATWAVSAPNGGNPGTITTNSGVYTAPLYPPPGGLVTVTASDGTTSLSSSVTIGYSAKTLSGPYAFSYKGNDSLGFRAVAGSFVADGAGNISSGVEDIQSFLTGVTTQVPIKGTYVVGPDGRGSATINTGLSSAATWRFALTTNLHASLIRFDSNNTGSGTIDQQNANAISVPVSASVLSGPYVFRLSGLDASFGPLGLAGKFNSSGNGTIPASGNILDVNDNGSVTASDSSLAGSYALDPAFSGTGRGTLTLTSTSLVSRQYAFYLIDSTRLRLVEIDHAAYTSGDALASPTGSSFTNSSLAAQSYAFTVGGNSNAAAFAAGGVFNSDGNGNVTAGAIDTNSAGTAKLNTSLTSCAYSVDAASGRVDLKLCSSGSTREFAAYPAASGSVVLLEIDSGALATGVAFPQQTTTTTFTANYILNLAGQGLFHNATSLYQQDVDGELTLNGSGTTAGNLDINNFSAVFPSDPISTTGTTTIAAAGTNGRGTAVLVANGPSATYNIVYYLVDANTVLVLDSDTNHILTGIFNKQF
jgi:hypothetical protein